MNDFTKEELKKLYNLVRFDSIEYSSELKENLKDKIQSMIDNYCDHKQPIYFKEE